MTREEFERIVADTYGIKADYPFEEDFVTGVFRHSDSGRWFGIAMRVSRSKLGLSGNEEIDIVNLKCAPEIIESLAGVEPGIFRAYHMNKMHWLSVLLDGSCNTDTLIWLLGISYDLTKSKLPKCRTKTK